LAKESEYESDSTPGDDLTFDTLEVSCKMLVEISLIQNDE
jgi:hypothetical protein